MTRRRQNWAKAQREHRKAIGNTKNYAARSAPWKPPKNKTQLREMLAEAIKQTIQQEHRRWNRGKAMSQLNLPLNKDNTK